MGSFRSAKAREADIATLTPDDRPEKVKPDDWLEEGEWIKYLTVTPASMAKRLADEGTVARMDKRGRGVADISLRAGTMSQIRLEEGIVTWHLLDEEGKPVAWDKARASYLLDGIPSAVRQALNTLIGSANPDTGDDDEADEETGERGNA